jgi:hypothetical protein
MSLKSKKKRMKFFIGLAILCLSFLHTDNGMATDKKMITECDKVASPSTPEQNYYCHSTLYYWEDEEWKGERSFYSEVAKNGKREF